MSDRVIKTLRKNAAVFASVLTAMLLVPATAFAGENITLPAFATLQGDWMMKALWIVFGSAIVGLIFGATWFVSLMKENPGSKGMQNVSNAVAEGAVAYLKKQISTMIWFVIIIAAGMVWLYGGIKEYTEPPTIIPLNIGIAIAFVLGVACSYLAGVVGMMMAVRANCRVANAALTSYKKSLYIAFRSGAVSGMATVGLGLLGACILFFLFKEETMKVLVGFGFGGCLAALFMRIGGGIFTKAADVGADLVGKVEKDLPEDDPRNAATIADNVGDNVGDCAGMAADVFESYEVTLVAAIILGAAAKIAGAADAMVLAMVVYPLLIRAIGVFASIIGIYTVKGSEDINSDPMKPISRGYLISGAIATIGFGFISYMVFTKQPIIIAGITIEWWRFALANFMGVVLAIVIEKITGLYTAIDGKPVTECAKASKSGPATVILSGFGSGLESAVWSILAVGAAILASYMLFPQNEILAAYGVALSGLGLLATTGFMLAMDTYGPISDNANGVFEMSGALKEANVDPKAHKIVAKLDAVGNTTKALTKGLAIATAVIAAVSLFHSFTTDAGLSDIRINVTKVFIGLLIGGAVPFLFSAMAINAVTRAAFDLVQEVRRQFREIVGIMDYDPRNDSDYGKPEYQKCVAISTAAAQKELMSPAILAIASPVFVAFALGIESLGGFLVGAILTGQLMAVLLSNAGGLWDNAKKKIEDGMFGGKGTDEHKATVVGDTVGDPFKDTAGPAINPLIKVMNLVALLLAPVLAIDKLTHASTISDTTRIVVSLVCVAALIFAVAWSKRGGIDVTGSKD